MLIIYTFIGSCIASHAIVVFERLARAEDFIAAPSRCQNCQALISWHDMLPIISFIWLRGRCRHCHAPIPALLFSSELTGGLLGTLLYSLNLPLANQFGFGILLFFVGIATLQDSQKQEFDLNLFLAPATIGIFRIISYPPDIIIFLFGIIVSLILGWLVARKQLGLGDLLFYLIIGFNSDFLIANRVLLIASGIVILQNFQLLICTKTHLKTRIAFLPALYFGLIATIIIEVMTKQF